MSNTFPSSGNVGIGTTSPSYLLQVAGGDIDIDNGQAIRSGSDALISNNGSNVIQVGSANVNHALALLAGGSEQIRLATDGNVGIGITNPLATLNVGGDILFGSEYDALKFPTNLGVNGGIIGDDGDYKTLKLYHGNSIRFGIGNDGAISNEKMRVASNGNIGIGTPNPTAKLQVAGDILFDSENNSLRFPTNLGVNGGIIGDDGDYKTLKLYHGNSIRFGIGNNGSISNEKMRVASNGNIGLGTPNPTEKLQVAGNILFDSEHNSLKFPTNLGVNGGIVGDDGNYKTLKLYHGDSIRFGIGNDGSFSNEKMRIDSSGNIGIGTTSPQTKLHVVGSGDAEISIESSDASARRWALQSSGNVSGNLGKLQIIDRTASASRMTVDTNGNVGIGQTSPTAKLQVDGDTYQNGGQRVKVSTINTNTTLDATYHTLFVNTSSGGTVTVTLPLASNHLGREFRVKNKDKGMVAISGTIDGKSAGLLLKMNDAATLVSDGSGWFIV